MGNLFSRKPKKPKRISLESNERGSDSNCVTVSSEYKDDQLFIKKLLKDLKKNPDIFILNHIIMSVMFFEDFERDITTYKKNESNVSPTLLKEYQKGCLQLDIIPDIITEYIKFKPQHGPKKNIYESLLGKRIYVMYDNFEIIVEEDEDEDYCGIDKPRYRGKLVDTSKNGYVRLKYIPDPSRSRSSSSSSVSSETESQSSSSGGLNAEPEEGNEDEVYSRVNNLRTLKELNIYDFCDSILFPENFIQKVSVRYEDQEFSVKESYLNSEVIMKHFQSKSVQERLLKSLEFDEEDINKAQCTGTSIFITNVKNDCFINWEIVPAVNIPWPESQAFEWYYRRDRNVVQRDNLFFKWPTSRMLDVIKKIDCAVIPRGYIPKRGVNKKHHLEWEISFPRVEKYLETKFKHFHMKHYLVIAALFKTFIEPKTEKRGILMEHFRNQLYWEVEQNALDWSEDRMGKKILSILNNFYEKLSTAELSDYFIRDKNIFENIPSPLLRKAQDKINDILTCPVVHFIAALRNIHYIKTDFYPQPDFQRLYRILTESGFKNTNPEIFKKIALDERNVHNRRAAVKNPGRKKYKKKLEKKKVNFEEIPVNKEVEKKGSQESLDFQWTSNQDVEISEEDLLFKERLILMFFLDHFIEMAKAAINLKVINQAKFYVKRCYYLQNLLVLIFTENEDTKLYDKEIKKLQKVIHINNESPPEPPARGSLHAGKALGRQSDGSEPGPSRITYRSSEVLSQNLPLGHSDASNSSQRPKSLNLSNTNFPPEEKGAPKTFLELMSKQ